MQDERKKVLLVNIRNEFIYNNTQLDGYPCISVTILTIRFWIRLQQLVNANSSIDNKDD